MLVPENEVESREVRTSRGDGGHDHRPLRRHHHAPCRLAQPETDRPPTRQQPSNARWTIMGHAGSGAPSLFLSGSPPANWAPGTDSKRWDLENDQGWAPGNRRTA